MTPTPSTPATPDLPPAPTFPDPAAEAAADEAARNALALAEVRAFLGPLAANTPQQVALYRAKHQSPRARAVVETLRKINAATYIGNGGSVNVLQQAERLVGIIAGWGPAADKAERALQAYSALSGVECHRTEAMRANHIWPWSVEWISLAFRAVGATEPELAVAIVGAEEWTMKAVLQDRGGRVRAQGRPPIAVKESPRPETRETILDFNPMKDP